MTSRGASRGPPAPVSQAQPVSFLEVGFVQMFETQSSPELHVPLP